MSEGRFWWHGRRQTVQDSIEYAGISMANVKIVFVNNRGASFGTVLNYGDRVGLTPAVGTGMRFFEDG